MEARNTGELVISTPCVNALCGKELLIETPSFVSLIEFIEIEFIEHRFAPVTVLHIECGVHIIINKNKL